ncbi:ParB/RepB/Spo0J family partition protein [bacterium]|nr:ParB/RepB/Spo0J family partition protein [bacterium]
MANQRPVLGKGLASLLPGANTAAAVAAAASVPAPSPAPVAPPEFQPAGASVSPDVIPASSRDRHMGIAMIGIDEIAVNPYQPRREFDDRAVEELSASIKVNGIIQPLVVRKVGSGQYQLIAGERRLRAAKKAGLTQVPIVVRKSTDRESLEIALVENIQRQDLNCIDEALAYFQLMQDFSLTQEEVAQRVGKERATVANCLRLLRLPEEIIEDLKKQVLSPGHGKALLALEDNESRLRVRSAIVEKGMSVRETEEMISQIRALAAVSAASAAEESSTAKADVAGEITTMKNRLTTLAQDLTRFWSTRVELKGSESRGKIILHYGSREELDRILSSMHNDTVWVERRT